MSLVEQLNRMHEDIPGCETVVFGDIQTGTVLRVNAGRDLRQEDHDRRLEEAALCLGKEASEALQRFHAGAQDTPELVSAFLSRDGSGCLFLPTGDALGEVVCVSLAEDASPSGLEGIVRRLVQGDG